jgi:outer membrane lipoprotein-sorting protein
MNSRGILNWISLLSAALALGAPFAGAAEQPSADEILKQVEKKLHSKDEVATVKMVILEANGSTKERKIQVSRRTSDADQAVLVKLQSPADLRGTGLLSVIKGKDSDQWLYLPSSKQTRRILSGKRQANFLDSELSYEDLGGTNGIGFTNSILKTESDASGPLYVIQSQTASTEGSYSKILTWVSTKTSLASKIEYYDHAGKLLKTMEMKNYKQFTNGIWRAQLVTVTNLQNHRGTRLELSDLKLDQGLSAQEFTPTALQSE